MTSSNRIRKGFLASALAALACTLMLAVPATSSALPGKWVTDNTDQDQAYLAIPRVWSTSPSGCFATFKELYPCLRIMKPKAIWISGYFSGGVGWEFGDGQLSGWTIECKKGRQTGSRQQLNRDGLAEGEYWVGRKTIKLPMPMRNPSWCEVDVSAESPYYIPGYELWWDSEMIVDASVEIRATSRR